MLGKKQVRELQLNKPRGFTLIELMVTISLVGVLMAVVAPYLTNAISNARARNVVSKFRQDFSWLRNQAATGNKVITLTLNADCSWSSSIDAAVDTSRSLSSTEIANSSSISCSPTNTTVLPVTFNFTNQGFVNPTATFVFNGPNGQKWPVQILSSGTVILTQGAS